MVVGQGIIVLVFMGLFIVIMYSLSKSAEDAKKLKKMEESLNEFNVQIFNGSNVRESNKRIVKNFGRIEGTASFTLGLPNIENSKIHVEAKYNLLKKAEEMGANAIINYHIQNTFYNGPMRQIMASGNAVILEDVNRIKSA